MSFRNISAWAIRNPMPPILLFIALMLAGTVAFIRMDINQDPDIDFPAVNVVIMQPGAAPTELETQVTRLVEAAVRGVSGVDEVNSSVQEGDSSTFIQFNIGTPIDRAVNDVRDAVTQIRAELPNGILEPRISRVDIAGGPLAYVSVEAVDATLEELSWFVDNTVAKRLLAIPGMAQVSRGGGVDREIRIMLDPVKLQRFGITAAQVNSQLLQINLNATGGRAEIAGSEQAVRVLGNAADAYSLGEQQISVGNGQSVKLASLGEVRDSYGEQRKLSRMDGKQVLSFSFSRAKGSSDVTVYDDAVKAIDELRKAHPKYKFDILFNTVDYTRGQYDSAMSAMIEGAILAVLVVWLFLRDWRATVIAAFAIPLSAIPAFFFMDLMGFTLNTLSLLALSLVAGVLVDDAIVEIENIVRHMRMGKSAYQASIDAADEIGLAVLATTMAIVCTFLPVGLMPGISGQFFKNFGLTIVAAVLVSLAVARLITPLLAAYFLKPHGEGEHGGGWMMDKYLSVLKLSLAHRWKTVGLGFASFLLMIVIFMNLDFTFQPPLNVNDSTIAITLPPGTTLAQTQDVSDTIATRLKKEPEVLAAFSDIQVGSATLYLTLDPDRKTKTYEFERRMAPVLHEIPDARIDFQAGEGGSGRAIQLMLGGDDPVALNEQANKLVSELRKIQGIRSPRVDSDLNRPEIQITPRFDLASQMGVTTAALSDAIRVATIGEIDQNAARFSLTDRQIPIRVALMEDERRNIDTVENLPVATVSGGSVPLKVVADISFGAGPSVLKRFNQTRRVSVGADLAPGEVSGAVYKRIEAMSYWKQLPNGVTRIIFGETKWQAEMITNFVVAIITGILMVFAVLVLLYKRLLPPFVNMASLGLAPLGSGLALLITGNPLSMPVLIGLLMLLGIVAKNSILLVDFALEEISSGVPKDDAIYDAGHKRAQPIVMTTVAMAAGMIPVALSLTGDGSMRAPMGITVMGGLIVSTVLTLVIVPAACSLAIDIEEKAGPWLARKFTNGGENAGNIQPAE